jgi:predicted pyridoxine 5'-phosphate oxidase superfamily flavin-nucleotide-binding protein
MAWTARVAPARAEFFQRMFVMGERFNALKDEHIEFIGQQKVFFVGTAGEDSLINVSPKGMDSFRVISHSQIMWLNLTGSGNETAAHVLDNGRMTVMFCSFDKQPLIMRLYGTARVIHSRDKAWAELFSQFPDYTGARQIFVQDIQMVQTSCGFAVPYYEFTGQRPTLDKWAINKGRGGIEQYWKDKNTRSLDGKPTGID